MERRGGTKTQKLYTWSRTINSLFLLWHQANQTFSVCMWWGREKKMCCMKKSCATNLLAYLIHKVNQSGKVFPLLHTKENRNVQHENTYGLYCSFIFLTAEVSICPSAQQEHNYVISTTVCSIVQWCLQEQAVHEY